MDGRHHRTQLQELTGRPLAPPPPPALPPLTEVGQHHGTLTAPYAAVAASGGRSIRRFCAATRRRHMRPSMESGTAAAVGHGVQHLGARRRYNICCQRRRQVRGWPSCSLFLTQPTMQRLADFQRCSHHAFCCSQGCGVPVPTTSALRRRRCSNCIRNSSRQALGGERSTVWCPARMRQQRQRASIPMVALAGKEASDAATQTMNSDMVERYLPDQEASAGNQTSAGASTVDDHAKEAAPVAHMSTADHVLLASVVPASSRAGIDASTAESRADARTGEVRGAGKWSDRADRAALPRANGAVAAALNGASQPTAEFSRQGQHRRRPLTAKLAAAEAAAEPLKDPCPTPAQNPAAGARLHWLLVVTFGHCRHLQVQCKGCWMLRATCALRHRALYCSSTCRRGGNENGASTEYGEGLATRTAGAQPQDRWHPVGREGVRRRRSTAQPRACHCGDDAIALARPSPYSAWARMVSCDIYAYKCHSMSRGCSCNFTRAESGEAACMAPSEGPMILVSA